MTRYTLDSVRSCIWVSARSSLHPINTETRGVTGWFEAATREDGALDLDQPVDGEPGVLTAQLDGSVSHHMLGDVDGNEALEKLKVEKVGLILSDINMPNMDGIEFLTRIKADAAFKSVPVLMVTTEGSQAKVMQALELGAAGYVKKPFTADQIKEKLAGLF